MCIHKLQLTFFFFGLSQKRLFKSKNLCHKLMITAHIKAGNGRRGVRYTGE